MVKKTATRTVYNEEHGFACCLACISAEMLFKFQQICISVRTKFSLCSKFFNSRFFRQSLARLVRKVYPVEPVLHELDALVAASANVTVTCVSESKTLGKCNFVSSLIHKTCERVDLQLCQLLARPSLTVNPEIANWAITRCKSFCVSEHLRLRQRKCFASNFSRAVRTGSVVQLLSRMDSWLKT